MNEIIQSMLERRSIKRYKSDPVPKEALEQIIAAGTYAASGMGRQKTNIKSVTNRAERDKLSGLNRKIGGWDSGFDPFYGAPAVLIVLARKDCPTYIYDGSLALGNMMLAAHALGLGSCWIHRAKEEFETEEGRKILESLGNSGEYEGIGHCIVGYPDEIKQAAPRKDNRVFFIE